MNIFGCGWLIIASLEQNQKPRLRAGTSSVLFTTISSAPRTIPGTYQELNKYLLRNKHTKIL